MNIQKPIIVLVLGLIFILIVLVVLISSSSKPSNKPLPIPEVIEAPVFPTQLPILKTTPLPTITPSKDTPLEEQLRIQTEADNNTTNIKNGILQKYPWYNQLPLQEKDYFVYFNLEKQVFIGKLYPQRSSSIPIEQQSLNWQQEIQVKLQDLNINLSVYNIIWEINPE